MRIFPGSSRGQFQIWLRSLSCFVLVAVSVPVTANEDFLSKPAEEWTEAEALQVLNDSPWARTITATTQDYQCNYEHPAYPGTLTKEFAEEMDSITPTPPATEVKPDGAEFLVRLVSVKPMQAAAERLISLDEKWAHYRGGAGLEPGSKPTNLEERWYNPADEITIAIVLKRPGTIGTSFRDYAYLPGKETPSTGIRHLWPCAAVRTANGVTTAVTGSPHSANGMALSFPSTFKGKPLISHPNERLEFRFIANQRVFEATFYVNPADLFDGTETVMRVPLTVDEPISAPRPQSATRPEQRNPPLANPAMGRPPGEGIRPEKADPSLRSG